MEQKTQNIFAKKYGKNSNIPTPEFVMYDQVRKPKSKKNNYKHRAGDWVCTICNNHNYAFRKVCNRCNKQSKE